MSIGYKIPSAVHLERGEQKKMWKSRNYHKKGGTDEKIVVSLPSEDECG
jgi:hypothetical protein